MPIFQKITKTKVPVYVWSPSLESGAIDQAVAIADNLPVWDHVSIMPDGHQGYALPIGGVLPLINAVAPYCVGVDIGCGVSLIKTNLTGISEENHGKIRSIITRTIPLGAGAKRNKKVKWEGFDHAPEIEVIQRELNDDAEKKIGTLGGGNHFIEIQRDEAGTIYAMIHSGSRHLGKAVADHYVKLAIEKGIVPQNDKKFNDLAYFVINSEEAQEYITAMNYALAYAKQNRQVMMDDVFSAIKEVVPEAEVVDTVNIHHNYAVREQHFGKDVMVHRKGATLASKGTIGLIPGSHASPSYIVRGRGNEDSFTSCSHGAGRVLARNKARKTLSLEDHIKALESMGIKAFDDRNIDLSESRDAYKNIDEVMENQEDLVEILVKLVPYQFSAIKG